MDLEKLKEETQIIIDDVLKQTEIKSGQVFVLGLSSSEVNGGLIGHASSAEIGQVIVSVIHKTLSDKGIYLAVQACEHLNRALLIEEELADKKDWEIVSVILIRELKLDEPEAHRYIEKQAMDRCISKRIVAEEIIKTYS